jgi:hypothetical protein
MMNSKITIFVLFVLLCLIATSTMQAQVAISPANSSDNTTHAGAVLKLVSNGSQGLLLPTVNLTNASTWGLGGSSTDGMVVYNRGNSIPKGFYVWIESRWRPMQTPVSGSPTVGSITFTPSSSVARNSVFHASVAAQEGVTYTWIVPGSNIKGYSNTNVISLVGLSAGTYTISVTATNAFGSSSPASGTVTIQ